LELRHADKKRHTFCALQHIGPEIVMAKKTKPRRAPVEHGPKFRTHWRHARVIDQEIRSGKAPNCPTLCRILEVSRRTVMRDLDFLRDDLGAPLAYHPDKRGYVYTQPHWSLPNIRITEGELLAFLLAESALEAYAGTPWAERLRKVFEGLADALPERVQVRPHDLLQRLRLDGDAPAVVGPQILQILTDAIEHNRTLKLRCFVLYRGKEKDYVLDPYVLRRARGAWYLVGRSHDDGRIPILNVSRIRHVAPTGDIFDYIASNFDPKAYFAETFGVMHSNGLPEHVVIEFSDNAAILVEERQWHPQQKITRLPEGRIRLELTVSHLWDIWPWVLSWGGGAKVIAPPELVNLVAVQAAETAGLYGRTR
jgi:predicted DNA-binding transcriptional regulator YafY